MFILHFWEQILRSDFLIMKKWIVLICFSACFCAFAETENKSPAGSEVGSPIRPLAQDYVELAHSPTGGAYHPVYTPSVIKGLGKRLIAAYEFGGSGLINNAHILTSDDGGKTWQERGTMAMTHGRLFRAGKSFYYLGHRGALRISRSDDNGQTWSEPVLLSPKDESWHQSACNVWRDKGNVYLVMERQMPKKKIWGWDVASTSPVVMRAKEDSDLTKRENWTFSNPLCMRDAIEGYEENNFPWDYFGVPFFEHKYPDVTRLCTPKNGTRHRNAFPMGYLESNIVRILDKNHYWYDPSGNTLHILMRANTGGTGYACLLKATENEDGTITLGLESVPSGKKCLFIPNPVGQMRFHVLYDKKTKLYWLLGSQATDSMSRPETLPAERYDAPNNERHRMVLYFSKNLVDWCFAGLVCKSESPKEARHYAAMDIDGDDLIILSRSGDKNAKDAHEGNMATFHRVKNFRDLVY